MTTPADGSEVPAHGGEQRPAAARAIELDVIRGVMIVLMVFGHTTHRGSSADTLKEIVAWIYSFHMPIFFFISGYLFAPRTPLGTTLSRQLLRLGWPYLLFQVLYLLGLYFAQEQGLHVSNSIESIGPANLLYHVALQPIGAYWFIHALLFYNLSWIAARALERVGLPFAVGLVALLALWALSPVPMKTWASCFLVAGYAWRRLGSGLPAAGLAWIAVAALAVGVSSFSVREDLFVWGAWNLAIFAGLVALTRRISEWQVVRHIAFIGSNTLVILLLHGFLLNLCKLVAGAVIAIEPTGISYAAISTAAGVYLPIAAGWISDRIGTSRAAFGRTPITVSAA